MTTVDARTVRVQCRANALLRDLLLEALENGAQVTTTKSGFMVRGPAGTASVHRSRPSDVRATKNFAALLRRIGALTKGQSQ